MLSRLAVAVFILFPGFAFAQATWPLSGASATYTAGNVGIGTTTPDSHYALDVRGSDAAITADATTGNFIIFNRSGTAFGSFNSGTVGELSLAASGTKALLLQNKVWFTQSVPSE